jgi:hypothetical protein
MRPLLHAAHDGLQSHASMALLLEFKQKIDDLELAAQATAAVHAGYRAHHACEASPSLACRPGSRGLAALSILQPLPLRSLPAWDLRLLVLCRFNPFRPRPSARLRRRVCQVLRARPWSPWCLNRLNPLQPVYRVRRRGKLKSCPTRPPRLLLSERAKPVARARESSAGSFSVK